MGVVGAECPLVDSQRALEEGKRADVVALGAVQLREVGEARRNIRVVGAEGALADGE